MLTALLLLLPNARAEDAVFEGTQTPVAEAEKPETHLSSELGFGWTTGNTMTYNLNISAAASHKWSKNKLAVDGGANLAQSVLDTDADGVLSDAERDAGYTKTAQKILVDGRYDRFFGEKDSLYALAGWLTDPFSGYDARTHGQLGYSRILVKSDKANLNVELGADVAFEDYTDEAVTAGAPADGAVIVAARAQVGFDYKFNDNVAFADKLEVYENVQAPADLRLLNTASITSKLSDKFSLKLSHSLTFDNTPVTDAYQKVDQTTLATFVASIL